MSIRGCSDEGKFKSECPSVYRFQSLRALQSLIHQRQVRQPLYLPIQLSSAPKAWQQSTWLSQMVMRSAMTLLKVMLW